MTFKKELPKYIFLILICSLIFFLNLKPPIDPDLGWHLRIGQDLLETKAISHFDTYSYTMPDWQWASHEWLSEGIIYFIYSKWGLFALSILFALITAATFFLISKVIKAKIEYCLLAALLGSLGSLPITGIRIQAFTLLGLAILLLILFNFQANQNNPHHQNLVWGLPFLFLIWVNLHGGVAIGLFALGLFLFFEGIKIAYFWLKKNYQLKNKLAQIVKWLKTKLSPNELVKESLSPQSWLKLSCISLFSFAASLINPNGYKLYLEVIRGLRDTLQMSQIVEWQPIAIFSPHSWEFLLYLTLLAILVLIYFKKIDLTLLGSGIIFGFLAFSSRRHMPLFIIITIPLWVYIVKNVAAPTLSKLLKQKLVLLLLLIATVFLGYQQTLVAFNSSTRPEFLAFQGGYPKGAVDYIKANPEKFSGNMFNEYNWGGYLIWQLPEKKVFIDGRMPGLKIGDRHIFKDFVDLQELKNPEKIIEKYNIDWMLIYNNRLLGHYLPYQGWDKIYEDKLSVIFKKE